MSRNIQDIFEQIRAQPPSIQLSEEELKRINIERKQTAYFVPKQLSDIFEKLPQEQKERYQWYGKEYYSRIIDNQALDLEAQARKHFNAVRSGLPFNKLTDDEKMLVRKIYGKDWFLQLDFTSEDG